MRTIIAFYVTIIGLLLSIGSFVQLIQKMPSFDLSQINLSETGILIFILFVGVIVFIYGLFMVMIVTRKQSASTLK
jgi:uncharacterized membrane protein